MLFNGAQLHLLVNHLPVVGFLGICLALLAATVLQSLEVKKFVLLATMIVGLTGLAPYLSGEPAEDVVEQLPGVSKDQIHEHEELAEKATILSVVTALAAGAALLLARKKPDTLKKSLPIVFSLSLVSAGLMAAAAHEGGKIRHPEITSDAAGTLSSFSSPTPPSHE
ncbi:MAG: hypothetical protein NTV34_14095 [Proteobacteria bacterium]|nr:hypothetical protein [Pseudomonadota bacterium]